MNATSVTDPDDAPAGGSNPFIVVGAPPLRPGEEPDRGFERRYADALIARLERSGLDGLADATVVRRDTGPGRLARPVPRLPRLDLRPGQRPQRPRRQLPAAELSRGRAGPLFRRRRACSRARGCRWSSRAARSPPSGSDRDLGRQAETGETSRAMGVAPATREVARDRRDRLDVAGAESPHPPPQLPIPQAVRRSAPRGPARRST